MRAIALATITVAACASDPPPLSTSDQALVMAEMFSVAGSALSASGTPATFAPTPAVVQVNSSSACAFGGTAQVAGMASGNVDSMTGTGAVSVDIMATFTNCAVGQNLIVQGAPDLSLTGTFDYLSFELSQGSITFGGA